MIIGIPKEQRFHEKRVAASPDTVKRFIGMGLSVLVEKGAGLGASITDDAYKNAGAQIVSSAKDVFSKADLLLKVWRPLTKKDAEKIDEVSLIKSGATVVSLASPYDAQDLVKEFAQNKINSFALELVPRITRAQSMDILSSQSNLAGYKAVLDAAAVYGRAFPMMMTAAGTVAPAKVLIMGAGVAGLQAIATARRLGAVVSATDVRLAAKEQVQSLGATFVMVEDDEVKQAETSGGYAKEMSDAYKKKQAALIEETLAKQDIAITTALIPGRKAPVLITKAMVDKMRAGSVIVDLAVEQGGNCEYSKAGEIVTTPNGVTIVGHLNVPSRLASDASVLFAKNVYNFVELLFNKETKKLNFNFEDEILKASCMTYEGKVVHSLFGGETPTVKAASKPAVKTTVKKPVKAPAAKKAATKKAVPKKTVKKGTSR